MCHKFHPPRAYVGMVWVEVMSVEWRRVGTVAQDRAVETGPAKTGAVEDGQGDAARGRGGVRTGLGLPNGGGDWGGASKHSLQYKFHPPKRGVSVIYG
eukprot:sb/3478909/